jgi:hypothetical protein
MKFMGWYKFQTKVYPVPNETGFFLLTFKRCFNKITELRFHSAHSPTFLKSFISGKEPHYKGLGHNPQFQLSTALTLPAMLGRNTPFPS